MILNIVKIAWSKPAEALSKLSPDSTTVLGIELLGGGATGALIGFDLGLAIFNINYPILYIPTNSLKLNSIKSWLSNLR